MKDVLGTAIKVYEENISELSALPVSETILQRYLPTADDADIERMKALVSIIPQLAGEMASFVQDGDRLPEDRALCVAALNYLLMPYDIIPDDEENGVVGLMDDAIVMVEALARMQCRSPKLDELLARYKPGVDALRNALPDWLGGAIDDFIRNTVTSAGERR